MAIKVNLLPREVSARPSGISVRVPRGVPVRGGVLVQVGSVILLLVVVGFGFMQYMAYQRKGALTNEIATLNAQSEALKAKLTELQVAEAARREIQRRIDVIGRVARSQGVPLEAMNGVLKAVPQGVWLTSFDMKPQETKVKVPEQPRASASYQSETLGRLESKRQELAATPAAGPKETREVLQLTGFSIVVRGMAFTNFQLADFMENLRKTGVFSDVDFVVTQIDRVEQTRVMNFEVTASIKL